MVGALQRHQKCGQANNHGDSRKKISIEADSRKPRKNAPQEDFVNCQESSEKNDKIRTPENVEISLCGIAFVCDEANNANDNSHRNIHEKKRELTYQSLPSNYRCEQGQ